MSSGQLAQNFLPASTQKLREPIPQNSKTWTSPFPKQATQGHVRGRSQTPARKCVQSYLIFPRTAIEKWHGTAHASTSTLQHKSKITIEQTKKCARLCRAVPQWKSALSLKIFNVETYSRAIACRGYLTSNQNFLIYTTHIKKWFTRRYFSILRGKITVKQQQVRNFAWHRAGASRVIAFHWKRNGTWGLLFQQLLSLKAFKGIFEQLKYHLSSVA